MARRLRITVLAALAVPLLLGTTGCVTVIAAAILGILGITDDGAAPNTTPSVIVTTPSRTDTPTVDFEVRVFDADGDTVSLTVEINDGDGWTTATVAPSSVVGSAGGTAATLNWQASADLGGTDYAGSELMFRVTPADSRSTGIPIESTTFAYGNDAPGLTSVTVLVTDEGAADNVIIELALTDSASDAVDIASFEVSELGDFSDALVVETTVGANGNIPGGSVSQIPTVPASDPDAPAVASLTWASALVAKFRSSTTRVRFSVTDSFGATSAVVESDAFLLLNQTPPAASFSFVGPAGADSNRSGLIDIYFELEDEQSDLADVRIEYSVDAGQSWHTCSEYPWPFSAGRYDLPTSDEGVQHRFTWDSSADLAGQPQDTLLRLTPADNPSPVTEDNSHIGATVVTIAPIAVGVAVGLEPLDSGASVTNTRILAGSRDGTSTRDALFVLTGQTVVRVYEGGTLPLPQQFIGMPSGNGVDMALADFDGDGDDDVFTVTPSQILVWENETGDTFDFPSWLTPTPTYTVVACGVIDHAANGSIELLTAETDGDNHLLRVLNGPTDAMPGVEAQVIALADEPSDILVVDIDGDGTDDVLVASEADASITLYIGSGSGLVTPGTIVYAGAATIVRAGDINNDGLTDLVVTDSVSVSTATATAPGAFAGAQEFIVSDAGSVPALFVIDVNRDGYDDVAFADGERIRVQTISPRGTATDWLDETIGPAILDIGVIDYNDDGWRELAVANGTSIESGGVTFFQIDNPGPSGSIALGPGDHAVCADFDLDGRPDVSAVGVDGHYMFWGRSAGGFDSVQAISGNLADHAIADLDGDARPDVVLRQSDGKLHLRLGSADRTFSDAPTATIDVDAVCIAVGDLDDDGDADVAFCAAGGGVYVARNAGDATFAAPATIHTGFNATGITLIDSNADGHLDVIYGDDNGDGHTLLNDGNGSTFTHTLVGGISSTSIVELLPAESADPDGTLDMISRGNNVIDTGRIYYFRSDGSGVLTSFQQVVSQNHVRLGGYVDIDGDGLQDLLLVATDSTLAIARARDHTGQFHLTVDTGVVASALAVGDVNGTGKVDVLTRTAGGTIRLATSRGMSTASSLAAEAFSTMTGDGNVVGDAVDTMLDRFREAREHTIGLRRFLAFGADGPGNPSAGLPDTSDTFMAHAVTGLGATLGTADAITDAWRVTGTIRFVTTTDPGTTDTGARVQVANRFGTRTVTDEMSASYNADVQRTGLSLPDTETSFANQTGVIVRLPLRENVDTVDLTTALAANRVQIIWRKRTWRRASDEPGDPFTSESRADEYLPRTDVGGGTSDWQDVFADASSWQLVRADADGDFSTGGVAVDGGDPYAPADAGPRFIVNTSGGYIKVLLPADGVLQAVIRQE